MSDSFETLSQRIVRWWRSLWSTRPQRQTSSQQPSLPQPTPDGNAQDGPRYEVQDASGSQVSESDSLADALQDWKEQTSSQGKIIDRATGNDVTPEPDDNGRYVVLSEDGDQKGSFNDRGRAEQAWARLTDGNGRIIDMETREDITPRKDQLAEQQLQQLVGLMGGSSTSRYSDFLIDPRLVERYLKAINAMEVPAFDIVNITGNGKNQPTKTVPVKRREVTIERKRIKVPVQHTGPPKPRGLVPVRYPGTETELRPLRSIGDIRRVRRRDLAQPRALLRRRIATGDLRFVQQMEEVPGKPEVQTRLEWQEIEVPRVKEWTDNVEVADEQQAQLLELLIDVSPSMGGPKVSMALALAAAVIGRHIDDGSEYLYRLFASSVGRLHKAKTPAAKRALLKEMTDWSEELNWGTNIEEALHKGAADVRARANKDMSPELLLITDGEDHISAESVYAAVGKDVVLHTVVLNSSNPSLFARSTTYMELWDDDFVSGSGGIKAFISEMRPGHRLGRPKAGGAFF